MDMVEHNRILNLVYEIIKRYASKDKPIDQSEIQRRILSGGPDNECDRKTISRALERLRLTYGMDENGNWCNEDIKLHYEVVYRSSSDIYKQYWLEICKDQQFTDEELMFLMDAVQFSKHVDQGFAEEITGKLADLSNNKYSGIFEFHTKVNTKDYPVRKDFFVTLGDINEAIHQQRMISFHDNRFDVDKKLHHVSETPLVVCPYRIVVTDGNYYLLCGFKGSSSVRSYRIDKITDVQILDESFTASIVLKNVTAYANEYLLEHRYLNPGVSVKVMLEIDRQILDEVIDSFGDKITIDRKGAGSNRLTVCVKSSEKDVIDWAMRNGEYAEIIEPDYLREALLERLWNIRSLYREDGRAFNYSERLERAKDTGRLWLRDVDLSEHDSYKDLTGIRCVDLHHNRITDFSFLANYDELFDLRISHNEIGDPGVFSRLTNLSRLALSMTGISDLNFLIGLDHLRTLTLKEFTLEDVEAIYSLPRLKHLTVNKPVARLIDKKRLKERGIEFNTDDSNRLSMIPMTRLPSEKNRFTERHAEDLEKFTTFEVTGDSVKTVYCSEIATRWDRSGNRKDKLFRLIEGACDHGEEREMCRDLYELRGEGYSWFVTYEGPAPEISYEHDHSKVYVISIFKEDHGRKLVAMAVRDRCDEDDEEVHSYVDFSKRNFSRMAFIRDMTDKKIGWAEVSGFLEMEFSRACTLDQVINPAVMKKYNVFENMEIDVDDYHYYRLNDAGKKVRKISYGWIEFE